MTNQALVPIPNFYMNGTEVVVKPALPPMGKLSTHCVIMVGSASSGTPDGVYGEMVKIKDRDHGREYLNKDDAYTGSLSAPVEYLLSKVDVSLYVVVIESLADAAEVTTAVDAIKRYIEQPTLIYIPNSTASSSTLDKQLCEIASVVKAIPVTDAHSALDMTEAAVYAAQFGGVGTHEESLQIAWPSGLYKAKYHEDAVIMPAGARLLAALASVKPWESPQAELDGCFANSVPVIYNPTSLNSDHNFLNKHGVYTFCHSPTGGIVCTGNRGHAGTFVSKSGLELALTNKLIQTSEIYKGKMMTAPFIESIVARLNSWIKTLKVDENCLIDAKVVVSEKNTQDSYRSGSFYVAINYGEYSPLEHFQVSLVEDLTIVDKFVEELKS